MKNKTKPTEKKTRRQLEADDLGRTPPLGTRKFNLSSDGIQLEAGDMLANGIFLRFVKRVFLNVFDVGLFEFRVVIDRKRVFLCLSSNDLFLTSLRVKTEIRQLFFYNDDI